jgi:hypothetical protein
MPHVLMSNKKVKEKQKKKDNKKNVPLCRASQPGFLS